jgi:hypothetical protein
MATTHPKLEDCLVNPERDLPVLRSLMVDMDSSVHQAGKLKLEGTYTAGKTVSQPAGW